MGRQPFSQGRLRLHVLHGKLRILPSGQFIYALCGSDVTRTQMSPMVRDGVLFRDVRQLPGPSVSCVARSTCRVVMMTCPKGWQQCRSCLPVVCTGGQSGRVAAPCMLLRRKWSRQSMPTHEFALVAHVFAALTVEVRTTAC